MRAPGVVVGVDVGEDRALRRTVRIHAQLPQPEEPECTEPRIDTYHKCTAGCDSVHDLIEKSNCINTCIGNWLHSKCP